MKRGIGLVIWRKQKRNMGHVIVFVAGFSIQKQTFASNSTVAKEPPTTFGLLKSVLKLATP
jgi:hypothetical protein